MPWHALSRPSLAIGVLGGACARQGLPAPLEYHGGLRFVEFLMERSGGKLTTYEYHAVAESGFTHALGDWVFAGALNEPRFGYAEMVEYAARHDIPMRSLSAMREYADEFVDLVVDELIAQDPELVGFSTTFMQNVPSLAVAQRLKRRRPDITVLFGGGNCDGPMGAALHREFDFVDLVLRGESDESFPRLLRALGDGATLAEVPGLCWRDETGRQRVNPTGRLVPPVAMARPRFEEWFAAFDASVVGRLLEPELVAESSRGCWWGEHHHCTFCGLNGTAMTFRAKSPDAFLAELDHLIGTHRVLDVMVVDNILDPGYLRTVLPDLAARDWDARLHYELKANLTTEQIRVLSAAGVTSVQPGIESLIDDVLVRMDKGVRAVHNVRTMRDCTSAELMVTWNWLYGFPGERAEDYAEVVAQLPALVHLQPPTSTARIELDRFSPHFNDPSLGFPIRRPAEPYHFVYDLPAGHLEDLVYLFDTPPRGLADDQIGPLNAAIEDWIRGYPTSSLRQFTVDGAVLLRDRRAGWPAADHLLETPREQRTWFELEHGRSVRGLLRKLAEAGLDWDPDDLTRWLQELLGHGLVFTEGGRWVSLATTALAAGATRPPIRLRAAAAV